MISVNDLNKNFGKLKALDHINLELGSGNSYALIGPNGSGKTTLIKCILGLVLPSGGDITVAGQSVRGHWKYREKIGYMPQIGRYPDNMTIGQLFDMIKNIRKEVTELDEELFMDFKLHQMQDKRMHTLSGGTRQKVSAAMAFLFCPPVLILDEPTAGLDPLSVEILKEKVSKERKADKLIMVTSHIMSDLEELTEQLVYLIEGRLVYNDSIARIKEETGFDRLGKAISHLMRQEATSLKAIPS